MTVQRYIVTYSTAGDEDPPHWSRVQKHLRKKYELGEPYVSVTVDPFIDEDGMQERLQIVEDKIDHKTHLLDRVIGLESGLETARQSIMYVRKSLEKRIKALEAARISTVAVNHVVEDGGEVETELEPEPEQRMSDGKLLAYMGTDAQKWAQEFIHLTETGGIVDEGLMLTWFANAIEVGRTAGQALTGESDDAMITHLRDLASEIKSVADNGVGTLGVPAASLKVYANAMNGAAGALTQAANLVKTLTSELNMQNAQRHSFSEWKQQLGEGIHTALRKAGHSTGATQAHLNINAMPDAEWDSILSFLIDSLEIQGLIEVKHGEVTKPNAVRCDEYFGEAIDLDVAGGIKGARCVRPVGHPPVGIDGIGHSSTVRI